MYSTTAAILRACHGPKGKIKNLGGILVALVTEGDFETTKRFKILANDQMAKSFKAMQSVNSALGESDFYWWNHLLWGLTIYTIYGKNFLLSETGERNYSQKSLQITAWRLARACCLLQGLPEPESNPQA